MMMMINNFMPEQIRAIGTLLLSTLAAIVCPTASMMGALTIACMFNVWCGMRADGVSVIRCHRFSWGKFAKAMYEFVLILMVIELVRGIMFLCGDDETSIYPVKVLTYAISIYYLQNAMKNLVKAYPESKALWIVYLCIRFEWKRALPGNVAEKIEQYKQHTENERSRKNEDNDKADSQEG